MINSKILKLLIFFIPHRLLIRLCFLFSAGNSALIKGRELGLISGPGKGLKMFLRVGDKLNPQETYYWLGFHEMDVQRLFTKLIKPGFIVYDMGDYIGFFSLLAGYLAGFKGMVYAFEPLPDNIERVRFNISLNGMQDRVFCVPKAVSDKPGVVIYDDFGRNDWCRISIDGAMPSEKNTNMLFESISLDEFVFQEGHPPPDLLKIDVEGGEGKVLAGARQLLVKFRPLIICEIHGHEAARQVSSELSCLGYGFRDTGGRSLTSIPGNHGHIIAIPDQA